MELKKILLFLILLIGIAGFISADIIEETDEASVSGTSESTARFVCQSNGSDLVWYNPSDSSYDIASTSCYRPNGVSSSGNIQTTCCASGYICNGATASSTCIQEATTTIRKCSDFRTESSCNSADIEDIPDSIAVILAAANYTDDNDDEIDFCRNRNAGIDIDECVLYSGCGCKWDNDESNSNKKCKENFKITPQTCSDGGDSQLTLNVSCYITSQLQDLCSEEGVYRMSFTGEWRTAAGAKITNTVQLNSLNAVAPNACRRDSKDFTCPVSTKVPFFTFFNLVVSVLAIGMIYYLVSKKKIRFI